MSTTYAPRPTADIRQNELARRASAPLARRVLFTAVALGVTGDALLHDGPMGIGFTLFVAALMYALARLTRERGIRWSLGATLLLLPIAVTSATVAWRASNVLVFYNLLGLLAALSALAWSLLRGDEWQPGTAGVGDYVAGAAKSGLSGAFGGFALVADARLGELARGGAGGERARRWPSVVRAALITLPILFVFGALFSAADPVFDRVVRSVVDIDVGVVLSHVFLAAFLGWPSAGYLRGAVIAPIDDRVARREQQPVLRVGIIEVGSALGALNALFLLFVAVQIRYLFGGAAHVQATAHMTYAEYARRGFFELVWVTAFALGTLILANGALRRERARDEWLFRALAWTLLALLSVVMASALQRMRLYQGEYGLTETRFYATVCMAWLGVVLAWFAATVLRGRGTPAFAFGAVVSAWLAVMALDVANPDALIARVNLARLARGQRFDASYVQTLSADAVPTVADRLPTLDAVLDGESRCRLESVVGQWRADGRARSLRSWNASVAAARERARASRYAGWTGADCGARAAARPASGGG